MAAKKKASVRGKKKMNRKTKTLSTKNKKSRVRTKKSLAKSGSSRRKVTPTRGRIQLFDLNSVGSPFTDDKGRSLVVCEYSDGSKRIYSVETISKNKDSLTRILGAAAVKRAIGN